MGEPIESLAGLSHERSEENARQWTVAYLAHLLGLPVAQIDPDISTAAHGLDSVDSVVMASAMEEHFGIEIDAGLFLADAPIADVIGGLCTEDSWRTA
jgi:acyl carrier protein